MNESQCRSVNIYIHTYYVGVLVYVCVCVRKVLTHMHTRVCVGMCACAYVCAGYAIFEVCRFQSWQIAHEILNLP